MVLVVEAASAEAKSAVEEDSAAEPVLEEELSVAEWSEAVAHCCSGRKQDG